MRVLHTRGMIRSLFLFLLLLGPGLCATLRAASETRIHDFGALSPETVEQRIRMLVPEKERVSMNPEAGKVLVVAEPGVQERIASMLHELSKPRKVMVLTVRHNRDRREIPVQNGELFTLPVSTTPPLEVVETARQRLPPGRTTLPVIGSVLHVHLHLLREDPAVIRLSITPAVLFGVEPPYEVVRYDQLRMDVLVSQQEFLDLPHALSSHAFYTEFLRTQPGEGVSAKPVALLLSLDSIREEAP